MDIMFLDKQSEDQKHEYIRLLSLVGSLSNLFSDSNVPYLYYRVAENAFCKAFGADNLSRSDCSIDVRKGPQGLGLKTFLENNGKTFQKVAEFNKSRELYRRFEKDPEKLIRVISELRNKRITTTKSLHNVEDLIYHCVTRLENKMYIYEKPMIFIDVDRLRLRGTSSNSVKFTDGKDEYSFNISKSTLLKRFVTKNHLIVDIRILDDPFDLLKKFIEENEDVLFLSRSVELPSVFLPLYSEDLSTGAKYIPEKSALNQWNAEGRPRDEKEVYIPIRAWIHKEFPKFFPPRGQSFSLKLPTGRVISARICQQGGKALMSNPNKELGQWLLEDVLKVKPGRLVTYKMLEEIGIDCVQVTKLDEDNFIIDFKDIGSFEEFKVQFF